MSFGKPKARLLPDFIVSLHVLPQLGGRRALPPTGLAGVQPAPSQLLAVLLHVRGQLALQRELIPTLRADEVLQKQRPAMSTANISKP